MNSTDKLRLYLEKKNEYTRRCREKKNVGKSRDAVITEEEASIKLQEIIDRKKFTDKMYRHRKKIKEIIDIINNSKDKKELLMNILKITRVEMEETENFDDFINKHLGV